MYFIWNRLRFEIFYDHFLLFGGSVLVKDHCQCFTLWGCLLLFLFNFVDISVVNLFWLHSFTISKKGVTNTVVCINQPSVLSWLYDEIVWQLQHQKVVVLQLRQTDLLLCNNCEHLIKAGWSTTTRFSTSSFAQTANQILVQLHFKKWKSKSQLRK